jgi:hypothetical protein
MEYAICPKWVPRSNLFSIFGMLYHITYAALSDNGKPMVQTGFVLYTTVYPDINVRLVKVEDLPLNNSDLACKVKHLL